jgi:CheY-like chemotaxis protein
MNRHVLFVDDDPNLLSAIQRNLRKNFTLVTAQSGLEGLEKIKTATAPFAAVVSDMRMPGMDGVEFLSKAREIWPETVRIMLTGQADMENAIEAVNKGNIFLFLNKPCDTETLARHLEIALKQYNLALAEKELLEKTLNGVIKLISNVLALADEASFSRAERLKAIVTFLGKQLAPQSLWALEMAAMLSQLGSITVPPEVMKKFNQGLPLDEDENKMIQSIPSISYDLLVNIPRFESVVHMIAEVEVSCEKFKKVELANWPGEELGGHLLKIALEYDRQSFCLKKPSEVITGWMLARPAEYDPWCAELLKNFGSKAAQQHPEKMTIYTLTPGMVFAENIMSKKGVLLIPAGREVSETIIKFLNNYVNRDEVEGEFNVFRN